MTEPKINPLTGHEDGLPDPRPRPEIWKEMLVSHQVDPSVHLSDIYYRLQWIMSHLEPLVAADEARLRRKYKRDERMRKKLFGKQ